MAPVGREVIVELVVIATGSGQMAWPSQSGYWARIGLAATEVLPVDQATIMPSDVVNIAGRDRALSKGCAVGSPAFADLVPVEPEIIQTTGDFPSGKFNNTDCRQSSQGDLMTRPHEQATKVVAMAVCLAMTTIAVSAPNSPVWSHYPGFHLPGLDGIEIVDLAGDGARVALVSGNDAGGFSHHGRVLLAVVEATTDGYRIANKVTLPEQSRPMAPIHRFRAPGTSGDRIAVAVADGPWIEENPRLLIMAGRDLAVISEAPLPGRFCLAGIADLDDDGRLEAVGHAARCGTHGMPLVVDAATGETVWTGASWQVNHIGLGEVGEGMRVLVLAGESPAPGLVLDADSKEILWQWPDGFRGRILFGDFLHPRGIGDFAVLEPGGVARVFRATPSFSPMVQIATVQAPTAAVHDVDGDGHDDLIVGGSWGRIEAFRATASPYQLFEFESPESGVSAIAVDGLEGDGTLQLLHGAGLSSTGVHVLRVLDVPTGELRYEMRDERGPFSSLVVGSITGDASRQVAVATTSSEGGYRGPNLRILQADSGALAGFKPSILHPATGNYGTHLALGRVEGDAAQRIFAGSGFSYSPRVVALDGATLSEQWQAELESFSEMVQDVVSTDFNGDGTDDVVAAFSGGLVVLDGANGAELWRSVTFSVNGRLTLAAGAIGLASAHGVAIGVGTRVYVLDIEKRVVVRYYQADEMVIGQHVEDGDDGCLHILTFATGLQRRDCDSGMLHSGRDFAQPTDFAGYPSDSFSDVVLSDGNRLLVDRNGAIHASSAVFDHDLGWMNQGHAVQGTGEIDVVIGGSLGIHRIRIETGPIFRDGFEMP